MGQLDIQTRRMIIRLNNKGMNGATIQKELEAEHGIQVTSRTINRFLRCYLLAKSIARKHGSGRPSKVTENVLQMVEEVMDSDDETTAAHLQNHL